MAAVIATPPPIRRGPLYLWLRRRSTIAVMMCVPLIAIIGCLVAYPFGYSIYLSMLNKAETAFVGFDNFLFLFRRATFWMVVHQALLFALVAAIFKAARRSVVQV